MVSVLAAEGPATAFTVLSARSRSREGVTQVIWAHLRLPAATQVQTGLPRLVRRWGREGRDTPPPATRLEAAL